jgi:tRNA 5-methylaminomethyl-2-thiouridine biosynthesis bifunctional protein
MKSLPVRPARLQQTADGVPYSAEHDDVYHPRAGALQQARHVFLAGNGLPQRWAGRRSFVVLETGFGLGNNFLATWQAWRADAARCEHLHFVSIERHPLAREDLARIQRDPELEPLATSLAAAWPPLVPGMHRLAFEDGRVELLLAFGDVADWARELVLQADAVFLDGFAPARNPQMWSPRVLEAVARRCRPGATAATWSVARPVREALTTAGFDVERAPGSGAKREITRAVHAPAYLPRRAPPGRPAERDVAPQALIVGGGLAGCAAAMALAEQGWHSTVFDRHAAPAAEGSGNPAGLFHGTVHVQDSVHARWNRAAALQAREAVARAIADHGVPGATDGLLRLETALSVDGMQSLLAGQELPPDYVQALDAAQASARAGMALPHAAWFYPGGGWVAPAALAASFLRRAGAAAQWRGDKRVAALERRGERWALLDECGAMVAESATVVLANAGDALRLAGTPDEPLLSLRGQLSGLRVETLRAAGLEAPALPVAGRGYLLPAIDGQVWFGATSQAGDMAAELRTDDHRHNLAQLHSLSGRALDVDPQHCTGRVAWRCSAHDRLPLIGALPAPAEGAGLDQPRFVPRVPGLFVFTGLGSRGITWAALGARLLASWVCGTPAPVEASLLEAVDPARFATRAVRRGASLKARSTPAGAG